MKEIMMLLPRAKSNGKLISFVLNSAWYNKNRIMTNLTCWGDARKYFSDTNGSDIHRGGSLGDILFQVQNQELSIDEAKSKIMAIQPKMKHGDEDRTNAHGSNLSSFANIDYKRAKRTGFPEAIFAQGKTPYQIVSILDSMAAASQSSSSILATRVDNSLYQSITQLLPMKHGDITYHETARIISMKPHTISSTNNNIQTNPKKNKKVIVACAGTTDIGVAEEAAVTLELVRAGNTGNSYSSSITVERIYDVGVAGLHRILNRLEDLQSADCIIVCAGMDGALPSVVGGLVSAPVIACPTSVGYGASFNGVSALLTMLNSCSPGVGVVNIDNGFGAAALAFKCIQSKDP